MIRSLIISVWIVAVTLGAVYFGQAMQTEPSTPAAIEPATKERRSVKLKAITVPVLGNGEVQGYIMTQLSVASKGDLLKTLPQPPDLLLTDEAFKTFYLEEQIDFKHITKADLGRLSMKIRDNINSRAGVPVAEDVYIEELHYLSKDDPSVKKLKQ